MNGVSGDILDGVGVDHDVGVDTNDDDYINCDGGKGGWC